MEPFQTFFQEHDEHGVLPAVVHEKPKTSKFEDSNNVFDFIVVGGGSAGAVVANRLSRNNKVLLLEAGTDPLPMQSIPGFTLEFMHSPYVDWMYRTVPQKYSHFGQIHENVSMWPRGKTLGGSSTLNYMLYKSLAYYDGQYKENSEHYGRGSQEIGLNVESKPEETIPLLPYIIEAGKELGFDNVSDLNGPQRTGFGTIEYTQKRGARHGTYDAYIRPIKHRKNLVISRLSHAIKIKLNRHNHAIGVWYSRHGKTHLARARKEIILSCGAVGSPQLLMLSGIGPKEHLQSVNIKPRIDLPVGQNLKDHLAVILHSVILDNTEKKWSIFPDYDYNPWALFNYLSEGKGPFSFPSPFSSQGFISTSIEKSMEWPNLQLYTSSLGLYDLLASDLSRLMGFKQEPIEMILKDQFGKNAFSSLVTLVRPKSVGEILLRDRNPESHPLINPNYLNDPRDVQAIVEGAQFSRKMFEDTQVLKKLRAKMTRQPLPGCEGHEIFSSDYWECYVRHLCMTLYHPAGTCAMGRGNNDPKTVVDTTLRVLNSRWLRVVDASIMPEIVNGNTNSPTIMIAEKASDIIREYWSEQYLVSPIVEYLFDQHFRAKCFYSVMV
ncbi:unnamed protein product [Allacma fusca]|uniref:Glucose-methanol-choline oxidoreductase N-terminal domain-containing protein n=1 Tax=Allacma fusca TaxID=39272 RepID=A0A8J2Q0Q7_9HEXA|nr:unnamed protein product [Allacma fusca]